MARIVCEVILPELEYEQVVRRAPAYVFFQFERHDLHPLFYELVYGGSDVEFAIDRYVLFYHLVYAIQQEFGGLEIENTLDYRILVRFFAYRNLFRYPLDAAVLHNHVGV